MVEKNSDKPCNVAPHSHPQRHKGLPKPNMAKSARGPSHVRSPCTITPSKGKHRKLDDNLSDHENQPKPSVGTNSEVGPPPNVSRQGSPNLYSRQSPSKEKSPRTSPSLVGLYAGAKFSEPPAPTSLPKPPTHWTASIFMATGGSFPFKASDIADKYNGNHLKMLLNVSV